MDATAFFENLKPEDWDKSVTKKWRVKDVLSHLVGWEREITVEFPKTWETGVQPWFMNTDEYDSFNAKIYEEFKNWSPQELLRELKRWETIRDNDLERIGEENIRQRSGFDWWFDEGDEPHFEHHVKQVKKALGLS